MTTNLIHEQVAPLATTETDLYEVPALTRVVISSVTICNRGTSATTMRLSASKSGGATATKDYFLYDVLIPPNDLYIMTSGLTLEAGTVVRVYAGNTFLSFQIFGEESG